MPPAWHDRAQCAGDDEFIDRIEALSPKRRRAAARAACAGCPVVRECATEALDTRALAVPRAGVWIRSNDRGAVRTADRAELAALGGRGE